MAKKKDEEKEQTGKEVTRRGFLQIMGAGAGAVASAATAGVPGDARAEVMKPAEMAKVTLRINGRRHRMLV
jgi:hypothetical protein